jgi:hypothetical protein
MSFYDSEDKKEYALIPEGDHEASLFNVTCDITKTPPTVSVQYKLANNRRLFQNFKVDEKGGKWMRWQMSELGLASVAKTLVANPETASAVDVAKSYVDAAKPFLGHIVTIQVEHTKWQGKTYERVKVVTGLDTDNSKSIPAPKGVDTQEPLPF